MAGQSRLNVYNAIADIGAVPVFHVSDVDDSVAIARACVSGGMRVVEFTNRGNRAHEVFNAMHKAVGSEAPEAILGAGTVLDPATAALYVNSWVPIPTPKLPACATGARWLTSPGAARLPKFRMPRSSAAK